MENQAGRVLAHEANARTEGGDYAGRDDVGRSRLQWVCQQFHSACSKMNRAEELKNLEWKIQCMETNRYVAENKDANAEPGSPPDPETSSSTKKKNN